MDFEIIMKSLPLFFQGAWLTIQLVFLALALGFIIAIPISLLRISKNPVLWIPSWFYIYCLRGTPLLVQLFLIYYGLSQFEAVKESFLWVWLREPYICVLIAFTLNTAAYTAEIIRGAIESTPQGEIEAAHAFGMSNLIMYYRVIFPSAFRRMLPAYSNEVIFMFHGSAVASLVTLVELTGVSRMVYSRYYAPFEAFTTTAVFYMVIIFACVYGFRLLEKRLCVHLKR